MWLTSGKTYSDLVSNTNSFVSVGDTGNPAYSGGMGSVGDINYTYQISKYEITNKEYVLFLNSVDPFGINPNSIAPLSLNVGDIRYNSNDVAGNKYYSNLNLDNKPVNNITFASMVRFCNWLHNGGKRYRISDPSASAPQNVGVYDIGTTAASNYFTINVPPSNNKFRLPSYSEWFKAAYYNGSGSYYSYATQRDSVPVPVFATSTGDGNYKLLNLLSNLELDILRNNNSKFNITNNNITNLELDILRNNTIIYHRISNLELDILRNNNSKFNITNNIISQLNFDILSNRSINNNHISASYNDIFLSNTNNVNLQNIISNNNYDIFTSTQAFPHNDISSLQIDLFLGNRLISSVISYLGIDCLASINKKYIINNILACDVLFNKKS